MTYIESLAGQTIAVAGGAGFIGRHLCTALLEVGAHVLCIDNFLSSRRSDLTPLESHRCFTLLEADILNLPDFEADGIINLASPASPPFYQRDPIGTLRINVHGTDNLLMRAKSQGIRLMQASTSEVYGDPQMHPQREAYVGHVNPIGPRACYDEGKRAAETLCADYNRVYGQDVRIARIFNTYGPGMLASDGRVVTNFISQALNGEALTIYGDGSQTRSMCFVSDTVEGLLRLYAAPGLDIAPVNIGNPDEVTMLTLAEEVLRVCDSTAPLIHKPLPQDDPTRRQPDISRARERLGWSPVVPLREGLIRTVAAMRCEQEPAIA